MESDELDSRVRDRVIDKGVGAAFNGRRYAAATISPQWEEWAWNLPVNTVYDTPLQDPATGKFYFMEGISAVDEAVVQ